MRTVAVRLLLGVLFIVVGMWLSSCGPTRYPCIPPCWGGTLVDHCGKQVC